jgi:hypothetical protein
MRRKRHNQALTIRFKYIPKQLPHPLHLLLIRLPHIRLPQLIFLRKPFFNRPVWIRGRYPRSRAASVTCVHADLLARFFFDDGVEGEGKGGEDGAG